MPYSHVNLAILGYFVVGNTAFALQSLGVEQRILGCSFLLISVWTLIFSHHQEMLRYRRTWLVVYTAMGTIGIAVSLLFPEPHASALSLLLYGGTAASVLLIPGSLRLILYDISMLLPTRSPGGIEALSLLTTYLPGQIERIRDATRYSLGNRPRRTFAVSLLRGEFAIAVLVGVLAMMHNLAAAAIHRHFLVKNCYPRLHLSALESVVYLVVATILLIL